MRILILLSIGYAFFLPQKFGRIIRRSVSIASDCGKKIDKIFLKYNVLNINKIFRNLTKKFLLIVLRPILAKLTL